jgi:hypothetical protein
LSTIEKDDGDRPAARRRTKGPKHNQRPPNSQHQTTSNRPVNARTRPNDEEEEPERRGGGGGGGTTTTMTTSRNDDDASEAEQGRRRE